MVGSGLLMQFFRTQFLQTYKRPEFDTLHVKSVQYADELVSKSICNTVPKFLNKMQLQPALISAETGAL